MGKREKETALPRRIDDRSRVALPRQVLGALGVQPGDLVAFEADGTAVRLRKVRMSLQPEGAQDGRASD